MKSLRYSRLEYEITFSKEYFNNLVIESPRLLREFIINLREQIENDTSFLFLFDKINELSVSKKICMIENCLMPNFDEKKLCSFIQKDVLVGLADEKKEKYQHILNEINDYVLDLSYDYKLPLSFNTDISLSSFLKAISLTSSLDNSSFLSFLIGEIKKYSVVYNKEIFILLNLHDYVSMEEMNDFFEEMNRLELYFLIVSGHLNDERSDYEKIIKIDKDLFDYYIEPKCKKS